MSKISGYGWLDPTLRVAFLRKILQRVLRHMRVNKEIGKTSAKRVMQIFNRYFDCMLELLSTKYQTVEMLKHCEELFWNASPHHLPRALPFIDSFQRIMIASQVIFQHQNRSTYLNLPGIIDDIEEFEGEFRAKYDAGLKDPEAINAFVNIWLAGQYNQAYAFAQRILSYH